MNKENNIFNKTLKFGFGILILFFVTGFSSAYLGKYIDGTFGTYPFGYIGSMLFSYILTILLCLYFVKKNNVLKK